MHALGQLQSVASAGQSETGEGTSAREIQRTLAKGDILFSEGENRVRPYRVQSGAVCHYMNWSNGRHDVIEFAFPGDIIGFGGLTEHVSTAQALIDTSVVALSETEFLQEIENDAQLAARVAVAADREFEFLRERALSAPPAPPLHRLASYILALSAIQSRETGAGASANVHVATGYVADILGIPVREIESLLQHLAQRGALETTADGLRIQNLAALEAAAGER
jgi:CRP/FNR family transcriptional regulator, anaerobic regulatory protein